VDRRAHVGQQPEGIQARMTRRDDFGGPGMAYDVFGFMFDPNLDGLTGYGFAVSAANVQSDMYLYDDAQQDGAWDAVWSSAVSIDDRGWTAEIRIPLSQLRYEASDDPQTWGINFFRSRTASNEQTWYSLVSRLRRGFVSQMGRIDDVVVRRSARRIESCRTRSAASIAALPRAATRSSTARPPAAASAWT
jgi:hypothetical protein